MKECNTLFPLICKWVSVHRLQFDLSKPDLSLQLNGLFNSAVFHTVLKEKDFQNILHCFHLFV